MTAYEVTFSAPKSVSLLWAFASPEVAQVASIAHLEAVAAALDLLERRAGATRQQIDGQRQRIASGMAAATFVQRTSRDGDPQLHTHCVVANLGRRPDGTYAALDATPIYEWGRAAGSVYHEELRRRLTDRLGVEWGPDRHGCRDSALDEIDTFTNGIRTAQAELSRREQSVEVLRPEVDHLRYWDEEHGWPHSRLRTVEAELADLSQPAHRSLTRDASLWRRAPGAGRAAWLERVAEVARPTLPGRDLGAGIDLGL